MNFLPPVTKFFRVFSQYAANVRQRPPGESVILAKFNWSNPAVHIEHCLTASTNDVDVSRTVIVWIDDNTESIESENCWHS
jgi:hypothetical protein